MSSCMMIRKKKKTEKRFINLQSVGQEDDPVGAGHFQLRQSDCGWLALPV